jgi:hypothetical protein
MTYLEAINYLLSQVGSSPVSEAGSLQVNVLAAKARLDEQMRSVQKTRWWFNIELNLELVVDNSGFIPLPSGTLSVLSISNSCAIQRGSRLYDSYNHTYVFTDSVTVDLIVQLNWEDLPAQAQDVILYRAAVDHVIQELEDYNKAGFIRDTLLYDSMLEMKKAQLETQRRNIFRTPKVAIVRGGVQPYRTGSTRFIRR